MPGTLCTASIVAVSFCEAHELARQDFEECLLSYPEAHERIKVLAQQRAAKVQRESSEKSKVASKDETEAGTTSRPNSGSGSNKSSLSTPKGSPERPRAPQARSFKCAVLKSLAVQRFEQASIRRVQPTGSPNAAPDRASPCTQLRRELAQSNS